MGSSGTYCEQWIARSQEFPFPGNEKNDLKFNNIVNELDSVLR